MALYQVQYLLVPSHKRIGKSSKYCHRRMEGSGGLIKSTLSSFIYLCALCLFISCRYNPKERLEIARYACHHGVTAAAVHFSRKLGHRIRESTVHSIKKAYLDEIKKLRARGDEGLDSLPHRKQGRPLLLGDKIDNMVQAYIRRVREHGGPVSSQIVIGAA